jgi:hypothetical protein
MTYAKAGVSMIFLFIIGLCCFSLKLWMENNFNEFSKESTTRLEKLNDLEKNYEKLKNSIEDLNRISTTKYGHPMIVLDKEKRAYFLYLP